MLANIHWKVIQGEKSHTIFKTHILLLSLLLSANNECYSKLMAFRLFFEPLFHFWLKLNWQNFKSNCSQCLISKPVQSQGDTLWGGLFSEAYNMGDIVLFKEYSEL